MKINSEKNFQKIFEDIYKDSPHNKFWNISHPLGKILGKIVKEEKPKNILEFGTSNGFSTSFIAINSDKNSIIKTIEIDETRFLIAQENFKKLEFKNIIQIKEEIFDFLENNSFNEKFDFIFLDAMQRKYLDIMRLLEEKKLLSENCTIVADNVISHKNMTEFIEHMFKNYNSKIIKIDSGFLIAKPKTKKN